ncbi:MAG: chemotaxis protein CheX [Bdellovibrionota bacterium]
MSTAPKIPAQHPFLNGEVILNFSAGVAETLQTMAGVASTFDKGFVEKNWKSKNDISVFLDLKSDPYTGQIRFHFDKMVLAALFEKMIGQKIDPNSREILDCMGEISNMCYGYAKAKLNEKGFALKMTIPHPCATKDLPEVYSRHPHIIIPFKVFDQLCHIQIIIF